MKCPKCRRTMVRKGSKWVCPCGNQIGSEKEDGKNRKA